MSVTRKVQVIPFSTKHGISILMFKTVPKRGGFWQCVTGKIDEGEDELKAAYREFREETTINESQVKNHLDVHSFNYRKNGQEFLEKVYAFEIDRNAEINLERNVYPEHTSFEWLAPEEAMKRAGFQSQAASISRLVQILAEA